VLLFVLSCSTPARALATGGCIRCQKDLGGNDKRLLSEGGMMHRFFGSAEFLAVQPFYSTHVREESKLLFEFDSALDFVLQT